MIDPAFTAASRRVRIQKGKQGEDGLQHGCTRTHARIFHMYAGTPRGTKKNSIERSGKTRLQWQEQGMDEFSIEIYPRSAGCIAVDAPVLLRVELRGRVLLPHVVVGGEQDHVVGKGRLQRRDGLLLLRRARDGLSVGRALAGPAGFGDDGGLATSGRTDLLGPV